MKLFKKTEQVVAEPKQTLQQQIQEIHETFFTEVQRLEQQAKVKEDETPEDPKLLEKAERLRKLGFDTTKESRKAQEEEARLMNVRSRNFNKEKMIEAIRYFQIKYPQYKFITEESVKKICKKYGLIYGPVGKYKGDVPEKNLRQIEEFNIHPEDKVWVRYLRDTSVMGRGPVSIGIADYEDVKRWEEEQKISDLPPAVIRMRNDEYYEEDPLEIAAPKDDFDTQDMEIEDYKLTQKSIPDPVVLQPVQHRLEKYYLIVTAWGDEASDPYVVNEKNN